MCGVEIPHIMSYPRVLFILKNRDNPYGCDPDPYSHHLSSGLFNSAKFVSDMLSSLGFVTKLVHVKDNNGIHKEVVHFRADVVIIEAYWVVPHKFDELKRACPNVTFVVRNHSDVAFLANEGTAMEWTLKYMQKSNVLVACNATNALNDFRFLARKEFPMWNNSDANDEVVYLPNYYPTDNAIIDARVMGDRVNIGCFGAIRPLKNQLLQAVAAMKFARKLGKPLDFHINATRIEGGGPILKNLVHLFRQFPQDNLVLHDWVEHHAFLKLVRQMDIVMQVSFSETFNIIAADAVVSGVPVVVSSKVPWVSAHYQANEDNSDDMVAKMSVAISHNNALNLYGLEQYDTTSIKSWLRFLARF